MGFENAEGLVRKVMMTCRSLNEKLNISFPLMYYLPESKMICTIDIDNYWRSSVKMMIRLSIRWLKSEIPREMTIPGCVHSC